MIQQKTGIISDGPLHQAEGEDFQVDALIDALVMILSKGLVDTNSFSIPRFIYVHINLGA
jgi:hypothetical protein